MEGLLKGVEDEACVRRAAHPPTDDPSGKDINHERHVGKARPSGDISEIANPQPVRTRCLEVTVHLVERADGRLVRDGGPDLPAPHGPLKPHGSHQPLDGAPSDGFAFTDQLPPDFPGAVDAEVLFEDAGNLGLQRLVTAGSCRLPRWIPPFDEMVVIGGRGDVQQTADRLDPERSAVIVDERGLPITRSPASTNSSHGVTLLKQRN